jgi:hypothetical protein
MVQEATATQGTTTAATLLGNSSALLGAAFLQLLTQLQREIIVNIIIVPVVLPLLSGFIAILLVIPFCRFHECVSATI